MINMGSLILSISGLCLGFSIGLGFVPIFKQPKNLIIQIFLGLLGVFFYNIFKMGHGI